MDILDNIYHYTYVLGMWVFGIALVMYALTQGVMPLGLQAAWSEGGLGNVFVLTQTESGYSGVGDRVAAVMPGQGQVAVFTVQEAVRHDGELLYRTDSSQVGSLVHAWDIQGSVVATVPLVGALVRALHHPIGLAALLGIPALMFLINLLLLVSRGFTNMFNEIVYQSQPQQKFIVSSNEEMQLREDAPMYEQSEHVEQSKYQNVVPSVSEHAVTFDGVVPAKSESRQNRRQATRQHESPGFIRNIEGVLLPQQHYGV